jgi:hypothetical protein
VVVLAMVLEFRSPPISVPLLAMTWLTLLVDRILQEQRRLKEEEKQAKLLLREYQ